MDILFRKKKKFCLFLLLIALVLATFTGCRPVDPDEAGDRWVCMDPYFVLEFHHDAQGRLVDQKITLEIDGVLQQVKIDFHSPSSFFLVMPIDSTFWNDRLLTGEWSYRGKQLVFSIEEDFVFDGAYSEICFYLDE